MKLHQINFEKYTYVLDDKRFNPPKVIRNPKTVRKAMKKGKCIIKNGKTPSEALVFSKSELTVIKKIRAHIKHSKQPYYFWLLYDKRNRAAEWEGGYGLDDFKLHFRNQFTIRHESKLITQNWR